MKVRSFEFCEICKNNYVVVNVQTAASDILRSPYVGISSTRFTLKKCSVFSSILVFIHFKLILESCATSRVYLEPHQTSMMKLLVILFSQKGSIIDIWQASKYGSAASFFNVFPLSLFGYLNEYTKILFFFGESVQLLCPRDITQELFKIFHWFPNHLLHTDHGNIKFSYIYTIEMRKSSL